MKLPAQDEHFFKPTIINHQMLENKIEKLETTRSCPTGFFNRELKANSTLELLHLRRSIFEYLSVKSQKTRNLEFVHLIKRINKELKNRNVNVPICNIKKPKEKTNYDEVSTYLYSKQGQYNGEYCYLARRRSNDSVEDECLKNTIISTQFFGFRNFFPDLAIPGFIHDRINESVNLLEIVKNESSKLDFSEFEEKCDQTQGSHTTGKAHSFIDTIL